MHCAAFNWKRDVSMLQHMIVDAFQDYLIHLLVLDSALLDIYLVTFLNLLLLCRISCTIGLNCRVANSVSQHVVKIVILPTLICKLLLANNTRLARMANTLMDDINYELG